MSSVNIRYDRNIHKERDDVERKRKKEIIVTCEKVHTHTIMRSDLKYIYTYRSREKRQ